MRKPLHKLAIALWIAAVGMLGVEAVSLFGMERTYPHGIFRTAMMMWDLFRSGIFSASALIAFGTMVELLDQIRWNTLPPEARKRRTRVWTYLRRWPHSMGD